MSFISRIIPSKKILVVDIWTYKVKVALCEYKNWEINLLSIAEKKQEASDIIWSEIANIEWVSNTVSQAISKAIKERIKERKLTRKWTYELAGISSQTFYEIISGGNYRVSSFVKVLNVLKMTIKFENVWNGLD